MTKGKALAGCVVLMAALVGVVVSQPARPAADDKPGAKDKSSADKPDAKKKTVKVEKKTFRIEVAAKGILEPEHAAEVAYRPQPVFEGRYHPGPLTVRTAVAHGASVRKGDVLVSFDTRKIDQAI